MSEFRLDSIIETIQKLEKAMTCPFCKSDPLKFLSFDAKSKYSKPDLAVACLKCNLKVVFTAEVESQGWGKPKKTVWNLTKVEKLMNYDRKQLTKNPQ